MKTITHHYTLIGRDNDNRNKTFHLKKESGKLPTVVSDLEHFLRPLTLEWSELVSHNVATPEGSLFSLFSLAPSEVVTLGKDAPSMGCICLASHFLKD